MPSSDNEELTPERKKLRESISRKLSKPQRKKRTRRRKEKPMPDEMVVVARNASEMQQAQDQLVTWADQKMEKEQEALDLANENLDIAVKNKWRTEGLNRAAKDAQKRVEYYGKVRAALMSGYVIVPNFNLDIFAIRTSKTSPKWDRIDAVVDGSHFEQESNRPQLGEGSNVDPWPLVQVRGYEDENREGKKIRKKFTMPDVFQPVDFPFKLARPQILDDTAKALALKIFDRIGVTPHRTVRKRDPMVIGEIVYKKGHTERVMSFLITWWVDTSDL